MVGEENGKINKQVGGFYQYVISSIHFHSLPFSRKLITNDSEDARTKCPR